MTAPKYQGRITSQMGAVVAGLYAFLGGSRERADLTTGVGVTD